MEIKDKTVFIKCLSKILKHKIIEEHIDNLSKRFKEGQRVRVAFGENKGKTGVILSVDGPYA